MQPPTPPPPYPSNYPYRNNSNSNNNHGHSSPPPRGSTGPGQPPPPPPLQAQRPVNNQYGYSPPTTAGASLARRPQPQQRSTPTGIPPFRAPPPAAVGGASPPPPPRVATKPPPPAATTAAATVSSPRVTTTTTRRPTSTTTVSSSSSPTATTTTHRRPVGTATTTGGTASGRTGVAPLTPSQFSSRPRPTTASTTPTTTTTPYYTGGTYGTAPVHTPTTSATTTTNRYGTYAASPTAAVTSKRPSVPFPPVGGAATGTGNTSTTATTTSSSGQNKSDTSTHHHYWNHAWTVAAWLVPTVGALLAPIQATHPRALLATVALALYATDLCAWRGTTVFLLWMAALALTMTTAWCRLLESEDDDDNGSGAAVLWLLLEIFVSALVYSMVSTWCHAHCAWSDAATRNAQWTTLHALVPPLAAAVGTAALSSQSVSWGGMTIMTMNTETMARLAPAILAIFLFLGMMTVGSCPVPLEWTRNETPTTTSKDKQDDDKDHSSKKTMDTFWISRFVAWGHVALLYTVPVCMHLANHGRRLFSLSMDDMHDLILISIVPYLMGHYGITWFHETGVRPNPYVVVVTAQGTRAGPGRKTTADTIRPLVLLTAAVMSLQQRYFIRWSLTLSYYFFDNAMPTWLLTLYWMAAMAAFVFVAVFWGRTTSTGGHQEAQSGSSSTTNSNQLLLGEYHEDVVQLALSLGGLFLGKSFGLPWNFTPLTVLAILGLILWMTTRMLRYLAIFLFVVHATAVVIFTYRFAGINNETLTLPIGVSITLIRLGLLVSSASIGVGLVTGLAVRSTGGWGAAWIKHVDVTGWLWVSYNVVLTLLEIALWKRPVPTNELVGVSVVVANGGGGGGGSAGIDEPLYDAVWVYGTSLVIMATTAFGKRVKIMGSTSSAVAMALAAGKALSIYVDAVDQAGRSSASGNGTAGGTAPGYDVWLRALVTALVCVMLFAPRVFVHPVHVKATSHRHHGTTVGYRQPTLPPGTSRLIVMYTLFFLPLTLAVAVPYVVYPLMNAIRGDWHGDSYYRVQVPWTELAGSTLLLWGLSCLAMLNYYLPDGGGQVWKKLAALAFLMGAGIVLAAPTLGIRLEASATNPYASISSLGSQLIRKGKGRTGGWGLLAACFATLLAITGPLELKERRNDAMRKDTMLLFRTMVFSLLFGGGLAWFLVMLCMRDASFVHLVLTTVCSLTMAFLGTIAAVLGHFVPLEEFSEVTQVFSIWLIALPILAPISGLPQLFGSTEAHAFGVDGWLSTFLVVGGITAFAFCMSVRYRANKNPATRGIANTSCLLAWACALVVLYGRFGVAGMDMNYDVTTVLGIPASVFGTLVVTAVLFALEGESGATRRTSRVTSSSKTTKSSLGINLPMLTPANAWVSFVVGAASIFCIASFYAICLRGAGLGKLFGLGTVAKSHEDVFASVFGGGHSQDNDHDLAALAEKAISHSHALATSAKLAASGFWTSGSFFGPLWHLLGLAAVLPSLWLLVTEKWLGSRVSTSSIVMFLPAHLLPLLLCRGVPTLQGAAAVSCLGGLLQWSLHSQSEHQARVSMQ